jgi:hypothetical protein
MYNINVEDWYCILVDRVTGPGDYILSIAQTREYVPGSLDGDVSPINFNDYYYIYLDERDTLQINVDLAGYRSSYVDLFLYDTEFNEVASDLQGKNLAITYTAEVAGYYYIRFYHEDLNVTASYSGGVTINDDDLELRQPSFLPLILSISIPLVCIAAVLGVVIVRKQRTGMWFWHEAGFKSRMSNLKRKSSKKLFTMRENIAYKASRFKKKVSAKVEEIRDTPLKQVKRGEFPVRPIEEIDFEESFDEKLKDQELDFLKKVSISKKGADKDLKKAWGKSWKDDIEFEDEE